MNALLILLAEDDKAPEAKDVVAGWTGFAVFLALIAAVALLCWSLTRQLRKAQAARDAGVYGDRPAAERAVEVDAEEETEADRADGRDEKGEAGPTEPGVGDVEATPGSTKKA